MMSKIAFVIVGWNNKGLLTDCFKSIEDQRSISHKIVYVDNDSSDGSASWVEETFPGVEVLKQNNNRGFAKGNNIGIEQALVDSEIDFVALINTDARLDKNWAAEILRFAERKPKGACYQGTTLDYKDNSVIDSTHIYVSRNWRRYNISELGPKKIFGVNAAACLISRKFIESQPLAPKLFDEALFMYLEDIDIAARSTVAGWDNYLVPKARAYHMGSVSASSRSSSFSLYMTFRNNSGVLFKNYPMHLLFRMWPKLIKGDIDTLRTLWRTDRKKMIWAVVKGRLVGILRLPLFIPSRFRISRVRDIDPSYLWALMDRGY
jgi:GT2 family glycosyltransferase